MDETHNEAADEARVADALRAAAGFTAARAMQAENRELRLQLTAAKALLASKSQQVQTCERQMALHKAVAQSARTEMQRMKDKGQCNGCKARKAELAAAAALAAQGDKSDGTV